MKRFIRQHQAVVPLAEDRASDPPEVPPNLDYYARPRRDRGPAITPVTAVPGDKEREQAPAFQ